MRDAETTVFLSCRRANISWAYAIFQYLTQHGYTAFLGHDYSEAKGDFAVDKILQGRHFIVILTPSALSQCQETNDPLRREIEAAIASHRNIVVVSIRLNSQPPAKEAETGLGREIQKQTGAPSVVVNRIVREAAQKRLKSKEGEGKKPN